MALFESFPLSECVKLLRTCLYAFIHLAISFFWQPFFLVLLSDVDILTWQSLEQRVHDINGRERNDRGFKIRLLRQTDEVTFLGNYFKKDKHSSPKLK